MGLNSKAFTVDGKSYTAGIEDGKVQDIILIDDTNKLHFKINSRVN